MKVHVRFLYVDLKDNIVDALGSDSVYILDGRNSIYNHIHAAYNRICQLTKIHRCCGYSIRRGPRFDSCVEIHRYIYSCV